MPFLVCSQISLFTDSFLPSLSSTTSAPSPSRLPELKEVGTFRSLPRTSSGRARLSPSSSQISRARSGASCATCRTDARRS